MNESITRYNTSGFTAADWKVSLCKILKYTIVMLRQKIKYKLVAVKSTQIS